LRLKLFAILLGAELFLLLSQFLHTEG